MKRMKKEQNDRRLACEALEGKATPAISTSMKRTTRVASKDYEREAEHLAKRQKAWDNVLSNQSTANSHALEYLHSWIPRISPPPSLKADESLDLDVDACGFTAHPTTCQATRVRTGNMIAMGIGVETWEI